MSFNTSYNFNQTVESDDEDDFHRVAPGKNVAIAVIDCNPTMFEALEEPGESDEEDEYRIKTLFEKSLNVIEQCMLERIIQDHTDLVSCEK